MSFPAVNRRRRKNGYVTFSIPEWRGLNEDENPQALEPGELVVAKNVWRRGATIGTRPGVVFDENYTAQLAATTADCQGIFDFRRNYDADRDLVSVFDGVIKQDGDNTVSAPGVTITSGQDNQWTFAEHANAMYAAGGADGDNIWKWTGSGNATAVTFQNSGSSDIDAKYIFNKWNYGFLCGMNGTAAEDNPTVVRYSALGDMDTWPVENTIGGTSAIGGLSSYGGEYTTGFAEYTDNRASWLLILTNKRIYSVLQTESSIAPFFIDSEVANGCVGQNAFVSLGLDSGDAIYMSERGVHSLRQSQQHGNRADKFLSWKIRVLFDSLTKTRLKYTTGAYDPQHGMVYFLVSDLGTNQDTILALDIKDQEEITAENARWYVWELGTIKANFITSGRDSNGEPRIFIGTLDGQLGVLSTDTYSDLTNGYVVQFQTNHEDFDNPGLDKGLGDIFIRLQTGGDYNPILQPVFNFGHAASESLTMDFGTTSTIPLWDVESWDEFNWASSLEADDTILEKVAGWGHGETISFAFQHTGTDEPFRVAGLSYQVRGIGEGAEELTTATG